MSRSTNSQVDPEVWFRIFHLAQVGQSGAPMAPYREQSVEIVLGPKGAFENGNIGTLRRRVPPDRVLGVVPSDRSDPRTPPEPKTPRVVELLRKAIEWKALLESGKVSSQAEIARQEGLTRARVTQIMALLRSDQKIQEQILSMPDQVRRPPMSERMLRSIGTNRNLPDQFLAQP